jgi:hypothetical protein
MPVRWPGYRAAGRPPSPHHRPKLGWTDKDITVVSQNNTEYESELETGQVDISFDTVDNISVALSRGAKVIGTAYEYGLTIYVGILANTKALDNSLKNQAIEDYTRRMVQYQNWVQPEPGQSPGGPGQRPGADRGAGEDVLDLRPGAARPRLVGRPGPLPEARRLRLQKGLLTSKVDIAVLMDNRYASTINEALTSTDYTANLKQSYS